MCQQAPKTLEATPAAPHACGCTSHAAQPAINTAGRTVHSLREAMQADEDIRTVGAGHDLDFPPVPFPSLRVIRSAGETLIRELVTRHHDLLRDSAIAGLYPADPEKFAKAVSTSADFIVEACGGTANYTPVRGHTCMRTRHFPFTIDESARETWLGLLWQALEESGFPLDVKEEYWDWQEAMSIRMINRRTGKEQPRRLPYAAMPAALRDHRQPSVCG